MRDPLIERCSPFQGPGWNPKRDRVFAVRASRLWNQLQSHFPVLFHFVSHVKVFNVATFILISFSSLSLSIFIWLTLHHFDASCMITVWSRQPYYHPVVFLSPSPPPHLLFDFLFCVRCPFSPLPTPANTYANTRFPRRRFDGDLSCAPVSPCSLSPFEKNLFTFTADPKQRRIQLQLEPPALPQRCSSQCASVFPCMFVMKNRDNECVLAECGEQSTTILPCNTGVIRCPRLSKNWYLHGGCLVLWLPVSVFSTCLYLCIPLLLIFFLLVFSFLLVLPRLFLSLSVCLFSS